MHLSKRIENIILHLSRYLMQKGWRIAAAESCSGGLLANCLTQISGSSNWFEFSMVTYSNESKHHFLGVSQDTLHTMGAVSATCAMQMVEGLMVKDNLLGVAITGVAGPLGGTEQCPVGTVYIAWKIPQQSCLVEQMSLVGERHEIAKQAVYYALRGAVLNSFCEKDYQRIHYFFALMLDDESLQKKCQKFALQSGLTIEQMEPVEHFHLTLSYLGNISEEHLQQLCHIANSIQSEISRFDLLLTKMNYWLGPDAFILQVGQNEILDKLSNCLQVKEEAFIPHLTLAKKTGQLMQPVTLEEFEQTWRIEHFSLMASYHGLIYFEKKRWKLI